MECRLEAIASWSGTRQHLRPNSRESFHSFHEGVSVDRSSIRITGPIRRYWTRTDYVNHREGWKQIKALYESNCATGQSRLLQIAYYKVGGTTGSGTDEPSPWKYFITAPVMQDVHDYVGKQ